MNGLEAGAGRHVEELHFVVSHCMAYCTLRWVTDTQIALEFAWGTLLPLPSHLSLPRQLPSKM